MSTPGTIRKRLKARIMSKARATHISLVDRPASRLPLRVMKREHLPANFTREPFPVLTLNPLARTVRKDEGPARGHLLAVVGVLERAANVESRLNFAGIPLEDRELQEHLVIYRQEGYDPALPNVKFRIDDDTVAIVGGEDVCKRMSLYGESSTFAEAVATDGFLPTIMVATEALHHVLRSSMYAGEDPDEAAVDKSGHRALIAKALEDYQAYVLDAFDTLPETVFRMMAGQQDQLVAATGAIARGTQVMKIVQRPPEQDDGDSKIDHCIAPNQQAAAAAAAEAETNPAQKQRAYNLAVAQTKPEWPADNKDKNGRPRPKKDPRKDTQQPSALNRETMHDTGREVSNDANRGHPSNFTRTGEPDDREDASDTGGPGTGVGGEGGADTGKTGTGQDGPDGATEAEVDSQKGPGMDNLPKSSAQERVIDPGPLGTLVDGGAQVTEEHEVYTDAEATKTGEGEDPAADAAAAAEQVAATNAAIEEVNEPGTNVPASTPPGENKETTQKGDNFAAILAAAVAQAMTPVVSEIRALGDRVESIDQRSTDAVAKADKLAGTVLGADSDDPLSALASVQKGETDPWGGLLDNVVHLGTPPRR